MHLLINEPYLRSVSEYDLNIEDKYITPSIFKAQTKYILPLLGTGLYAELVNQSSGGTLTALNSTLKTDYVQMALATYVLYKSILPLHYKFTTDGIMTRKSDTSNPISSNELDKLKSELLDDAQFYGQRVTLYLIANSVSYPLYFSAGTGIDTVWAKQNNYTDGIYTPNSNRGYANNADDLNGRWDGNGNFFKY